MDTQKKHRKTLIIVFLLLLLLFIVAIIHIYAPPTVDNIETVPRDDTAVEYTGDKPTYHLPDGQRGIAIPGITTLTFQKGTLTQKVNFFNPENNDCLFRMSLYADDKQYWQSGYCEPGTGYYEIELDETIPEGTYQAYLKVECVRANGTELNGTRVEFTLNVV